MLSSFRLMSETEARQLNPLQLAYVGDTVWDLMVRTELLERGLAIHGMHIAAIRAVNAGAQAQALERMLPLLTEEEKELIRRGRNAHAHHPTPKNQNPADYAAATALEALIGFLYLTGQEDRAQALYHAQREAQPHA